MNPTRICEVEGCANPDSQRIVRGMCLSHYFAARYQENKPAPKPRKPRPKTPPEARFRRKVGEPTSGGCTEWVGGRTSSGYGVFRDSDGKAIGAHRWVMQQQLGRNLRAEEFVCHKCDNPPCVNPEHLFVGSHTENMADMLNKGRYVHGESATLTPDQVVTMREDATTGALLRALAEKYGVSEGTVSQIVRGIAWKDAGGPISPPRYNLKRRNKAA